MTQYVVTAPCLVHVPFDTPQGRQLGTLYADAVLPGGVPEEKIRFWLDAGMIREVKAKALEPVAVQGPEVSKSQGPDPAKLDNGGTLPPAGGQDPAKTPEPSAPPESGPGSGKAAWIDYAVARGFTRADAEGMSRDDLIKALKPAE
jgi:hypothetical protein